MSGEFNFVDALRVCQISGDQVARVSSLEAFTGIENFLIRKNFPPVYIGLIRLEEFVTIDPLSFSFNVEENENKTFFQTRGELPWASCNELQPNDDLNNDEACVEWQLNNQELGSKNLWNDINCESIGLRALCQVQAVIDDGIDDRNNETKGASNLFFVLSVTFFLFLLLLAIQIIIFVQQKKLKQIEMY